MAAAQLHESTIRRQRIADPFVSKTFPDGPPPRPTKPLLDFGITRIAGNP
jgi:hypothetical protein